MNVTHYEDKDGKPRGKVESVAGFPKGLERPAGTELGLLKYSPEDPEDFDKLPEWLQVKIKNQITENDYPEGYAGGPDPQGPAPDDLDDEIPFITSGGIPVSYTHLTLPTKA